MKTLDALKRFVKAFLKKRIGSKRLLRLAYGVDLHDFTKGQLSGCRQLPDRFALYRFIEDQHVKQSPIAYLEFGVFKGASIREWSSLNRHQSSLFIGFDSFEGLPSDWNKDYQKGRFDTGKQVPDIKDPRVQFVKGWFEETLPGFISSQLKSVLDKRLLVLHLDADLFNSTLFVMVNLSSFIPSGTIIIFDEFFDAVHEFRAYSVFRECFRKSVKPVAWAGDDLYFPRQVAFRVD